MATGETVGTRALERWVITPAGPPDDDRYSRQTRFSGIRREGQERLRASRVLVVGCGGLGTGTVNLLARSGVGSITVVDRDLVEHGPNLIGLRVHAVS